VSTDLEETTMSDTRPGGADDLLELLAHQHRQVEQFWTQLDAAHASGDGALAELVPELVELLLRHDAIETALLYPELSGVADGRGQELSEQSLRDHQAVRDQLRRVLGADPADDQTFTMLAQCVSDVQRHAHEEEHEVFPLLRTHIDAARRAELCAQVADVLDRAAAG